MFRLSKDFFNNPKPPELYLCNTGRKILGQLPAYDLNGTFKWNSYSEIQFSVDRTYIDVLTGNSVVNPLFDKVEGLRNVYLKNIGYFTLQDTDTTYGDKDTKQMTAFSLEYATAGSKYLDTFKINTGEVDSKEVIYELSKYGANATSDQMYKLALYDGWDASKKYYHRVYSDKDSYDYEQIAIADEAAYKTYFRDDVPAEEVLYVNGYANVKFYDPNTPELSLLHLVFEKIPEWKIGNVDYMLRSKERKFSEDRVSVYDFLMNSVSDTFRVVIEWDSINGVVNFYEEAEDGLNEDGTVQTRWETDVYISRENLAKEVSISYSTDDIKTKLKVSGSDSLDIREVNLGQNYIMNLDYYHNDEWMDNELKTAYNNYIDAVDSYSPLYKDYMQGWVSAYNAWDNLMNAVPADGNVVLVGDEFKKLYCIYGLYSPAIEFDEDAEYYVMDTDGGMSKASPQPTAATFDGKTYYIKGNSEAKLEALKKQLGLYRVNEDIDADNTDNILLKLTNSSNDVATISVYNASTAETDQAKKDEPVYKIKILIVRATGTTSIIERTLSDWVNGDLRTDNTNASSGLSVLKGFKISYIGALGAYLVLVKDEKEAANLSDYGINMLKEKHQTYTTIFQTQTEAMYSQEKYQCVASDEPPMEPIDEGTRWLDTNSTPLKLYQRNNVEQNEDGDLTWDKLWVEVKNETLADSLNYSRYSENYEKLRTVQSVLTQKEKEAEYWLNGFKVDGREIHYTPGDSDIAFYVAADAFFRTSANSDSDVIISNGTLHTDYGIPIFTFMHHTAQTSHIRATGTYDATKAYYQKVTANYDAETLEEAGADSTKVITVERYVQVDIDSEEEYGQYGELYVASKENVFAMYLQGKTPYIAYANSQGVYMAKMNAIKDLTEMENFFTKEQWIELSPLIREDEYSNDNFLLTGYESEEERIKICEELMEYASKELKTLSQPKLDFSMTMANILALPEFDPIIDQFALGNFIRIELRPGLVKRARILEVSLSFDDLSDFSVSFGNLVATLSEVDKHAALLAQAVQAGKQVSVNGGAWQTATDKINQLEVDIANGLRYAALKIGDGSGQAITWDSTGMHFRKYKPGSTTEYEPEEIAIINNALVATNDSWATSKAAFGKYMIGDEERWGPIAEYITANTIEGKFISGGRIEIGEDDSNKFVVDEDGSVSIKSGGVEKYARKTDLDAFNEIYQYTVELSYNDSTVFASTDANTIVTAIVKDTGIDITHQLPIGTTFTWLRNGNTYKTTTVSEDNKPQDGSINTNVKSLTANQINITHTDIENNAFFSCLVDFDETNIEKEGEPNGENNTVE